MISKKILPLLLIFGLICTGSIGNDTFTRSESHLRLLTYNVWYGFEKVPDRKPLWMEWMVQQQPDVVCLQELNGYTPEKLSGDAGSWGHDYSVLLKTEGFPTGITSRYPIEDVQRTLKDFHHGLLRVKIQGIYFYVIHLHPSNWEFRNQEVNLIIEDVKKLPGDAPIVLAGDFNALSRSDSIYYSDGELERFFQRRDNEYEENNLNQGMLDYSVIDRILENGFIDTEYLLRPEDYYFTGTFPTAVEKPGEHGDFRRLDYVFVNENLIDFVTNAEIISNKKTELFSDHLPVKVDLRRD